MRKASIVPVLAIALSLSIGTAESGNVAGARPQVEALQAASTQSPEIAASAQARRKCRWVWRIGLVCETPGGTITI